ncbi:MAG: allantoinase AllB [Acidipropionibacterium sp.]|jgi:allantoinase|nr:allantoinase AllB [Acidipropionibacterium sp.]
MSAVDIVVRGGTVVLPDEVKDADLFVRDGRIAGVVEPGTAADAGETIDATGLTVMAGMIDTHVHLRDPGQPHRETFATGTSAAARGGVTTVLEMPSGVPAVSDRASLLGKRDIVGPKAFVDFCLYGGAGKSNITKIREQANSGAIAFKSFMNAPRAGADPGMESRCLPDDATFLAAMREVATTGRVAVVHAENESICRAEASRLRGTHRGGALAHAESRPAIAEEEAVVRALTLAHSAGARVSIAHVSTAGAVKAIRAAKARGYLVTAEACPHHLVRTAEGSRELGPYAKMNPPLRSETDVEALWEGVLDGTIDFIGSDHAPYTTAEKEVGWADIWAAPPGVPGVEASLPILMTAVHRGRLTLPQLTRITARNAAHTFGLAPRKGELVAGADADFVLMDLARHERFDICEWQTKSRRSARLWDGYEAVGVVRATFVRGHVVYRDGEIRGEQGYGHFLTPVI